MYSYKKMIRSSLLALLAILSGCAAGMIATSQTISTSLAAKEYNSLSSRYLDRPTWVSIETMRDGSKVLTVRMDAYGSNFHEVRFYERDTRQCIAAIDKYFLWESKAMANGDIIEKDIAVVPTPSGYNILFQFTSGNSKSHYLAVGHAMNSLTGKLKGISMILDHDNAQILKDLLLDLQKMNPKPRSDDYL